MKGFWFIIKNTVNTNGRTSIVFNFSTNGNKFVFGTGQTIYPELWDKETQRPTKDKTLITKFKAKNPQIKTELQNIRQILENIISNTKKFIQEKNEVNEAWKFDDLKTHLRNLRGIPTKKVKKVAPEKTPYIKQVIEDFHTGILNGSKTMQMPLSKRGQRYTAGTVQSYNTFKDIYNEFESFKNKRYLITEISNSFEKDIHTFFNEEKEYTPNYKGKLIKMLKVIINDFIETHRVKLYENEKKGISGTLTLMDLFHIEREIKRILKPNAEPVKIYLNENEIEKLYSLDLSKIPHYDKARDIFLTGCYTGLRHSDYKRISIEHIKNDWIEIIMTKGKKKVFIPIRPELREILIKWNNRIPQMSSQKLGKYIKEIGKMAGIDDIIEIIEIRGNETNTTLKRKFELITTHTARRSAATNMYNSGMNAKDIMAITGHSKIETFEKYIIKDDKARELRLKASNYFKGHTEGLKVV